MKALFTQLALLMGGLVAALSLALNLHNMDLLTAVFRATLVFFATVIVLFAFLHFFSAILVRFVAEQVIQNRAPEQEEGEGATESPPKVGPGTATPTQKKANQG